MAKPKPLGMSEEDAELLVHAIKRAEEGNRGEVHLHVEERCDGDPMKRAHEVYKHFGLHETRQDTGVILYVAIESKKTAVYAGAGVNLEHDTVWDEVVTAVADGYRQGNPRAGLERALDAIGDVLRERVPGVDRAGNEKPDRVTTESDLEDS